MFVSLKENEVRYPKGSSCVELLYLFDFMKLPYLLNGKVNFSELGGNHE